MSQLLCKRIPAISYGDVLCSPKSSKSIQIAKGLVASSQVHHCQTKGNLLAMKVFAGKTIGKYGI